MRLRTIRRGFTLIELLVVVAILVALAGLVLPKLDKVLLKNTKGIAGNNLGGVTRYVQTYRVMHNVYPDGFDSLLNSTGAAPWNNGSQAAPVVKGLDPQLFGGGDGVSLNDAKLTTTTIADDEELRSLARMGITKTYDAVAAIGDTLPGDAFSIQRTLAVGDAIVTVNAASGDGLKIIQHIYPQTGVVPSGKKLVVFGFGPLNTTIGDVLMECPTYSNAANPNVYYNRNLVIFEIGNGKRAELKAAVGADADRLDEEIADYYEQ